MTLYFKKPSSFFILANKISYTPIGKFKGLKIMTFLEDLKNYSFVASKEILGFQGNDSVTAEYLKNVVVELFANSIRNNLG